MSKKISMLTGCLISTAILASSSVFAGDLMSFEVTLTNITPGQPIAPMMVATHASGVSFFEEGQAPSVELASLAEAGNGRPMAAKLLATPGVSAAEVGVGGTPPGHSSSLVIKGKPGDRLSLGAMLGNTNDGFVGLEGVSLPMGKQAVSYMAPGYDAGTETNDELCATVPGPACGGAALSPDDSGEGVVVIHNGIHGIGGLAASSQDWRNPVAKVVIKRIK